MIGFFCYVAALSVWMRPATAPRAFPFVVLACATAAIFTLAAGERTAAPFFSYARDWLALILTLTAYREMDWFTPAQHAHLLEQAWIRWDRLVLDRWGARALIEWPGNVMPGYLEFCYLLVYAVGPFTIAMVYAYRRRDVIDRVLVLYLSGTLLAYAMFPFFPSEPPRLVFPGADRPQLLSPLRRFNLWVLGGYGIHSSVFPSAHVSSAFSAAWAVLLFIPDRRRLGWGMLIYAVSVAIATVYGRYHYAVDAAAGFGISLIAAPIAFWAYRRAT